MLKSRYTNQYPGDSGSVQSASSSDSWAWFQLPRQSVLKFKIHQSVSQRFRFWPISIQLLKTNPSILILSRVPAAQAVCAEIQNTPIRIKEIPVLSNQHPALKTKSSSPDSWVWFQLPWQSVLKFKIHQSVFKIFCLGSIQSASSSSKQNPRVPKSGFSCPVSQSVLAFKPPNNIHEIPVLSNRHSALQNVIL